ncbi:hypothetical protein [Microvirga pakistanensis]|uniref:hypothetical protein n=1 Tax=Microvirga pakistanensis TaxID=1682650 RepID=UPI00141B6857|nr:hypothetical protein [Microvirga pakistanensis]
MIGIGCLAPLVLFVAGAILGHVVMGSVGVPWGAGLGFGAGVAILGLLGWALDRIKRR